MPIRNPTTPDADQRHGVAAGRLGPGSGQFPAAGSAEPRAPARLACAFGGAAGLQRTAVERGTRRRHGDPSHRRRHRRQDRSLPHGLSLLGLRADHGMAIFLRSADDGMDLRMGAAPDPRRRSNGSPSCEIYWPIPDRAARRMPPLSRQDIDWALDNGYRVVAGRFWEWSAEQLGRSLVSVSGQASGPAIHAMLHGDFTAKPLFDAARRGQLLLLSRRGAALTSAGRAGCRLRPAPDPPEHAQAPAAPRQGGADRGRRDGPCRRSI